MADAMAEVDQEMKKKRNIIGFNCTKCKRKVGSIYTSNVGRMYFPEFQVFCLKCGWVGTLTNVVTNY